MRIIERTPTLLHIRARSLSLRTFHHALRAVDMWRWVTAIVGLLALFTVWRKDTALLFVYDASESNGSFTNFFLIIFAIYGVSSLYQLVKDLVRAGTTDLVLNPRPVTGPDADSQTTVRKATVYSQAKGVHWNREKFTSSGNVATGAKVTEITRFNKSLYRVSMVMNHGDSLIVDGFASEAEARDMVRVINEWCQAAWAEIETPGAAAAEVGPQDT